MTGLAKILVRKSVMTDAPFSNCGNQERLHTLQFCWKAVELKSWFFSVSCQRPHKRL